MKKRQFEAIAKQLLPHLPGYASNGWLIFATPIGHVLRGFGCDGSGFDPEIFTVWVFFLPLYVPTEGLPMSMGERLKDDRRCEKWWNVNDPDLVPDLERRMRRQGLPFLHGVEEPLGLARVIRKRYRNTRDPYQLEAMAYSLLMGGEIAQSRETLDKVIALLDPGVGWQKTMRERAASLKTLGREDARRQLAEWEARSLENLRREIGDVAEPDI